MNAISPIMLEPEPIDIDPRQCHFCGCKIDQHERVDTPEGPEFLCYPDDDIVTAWELADPRDAWRRSGESPPPASIRNSDISGKPASAAKPYRDRTPQATVEAFWYVIGLADPERLTAWLDDHSREAPFLLKLLESK